MKRVQFLFRQVQRMRNILVILALLVCTSICLGGQEVYIVGDANVRKPGGNDIFSNIAGNGVAGNGKPVLSFHVDPKELWDDPTGNTITIYSGAQVGNVYGACMNDHSIHNNRDRTIFTSMTNNKVIVESGRGGSQNLFSNFHNNDIVGAFANNDIMYSMNVSSNSVIIRGGANINNVQGGRGIKGIVSSNTVTIGGVEDVTIKGCVLGGNIGNGTVSLNTVTITTGTTVNNHVYGGWVNTGNAIDNRVNLTSVTVSNSVYGGWVNIGNAIDNKVTINGGNIKGEVCGGRTSTGTVSSNTVIITTGTTVTLNVFGGCAITKGTVSFSTVTISGGRVDQNVYGGYTINGTVSSNTVTITTGTTVTLCVFGGNVINGDAIDNKVTLISGTVRGNISGGWVFNEGNAMYNTVTIKDGKIDEDVVGGCTSTGTVSSNTVTIISGAVKNVFGGDAMSGTATLNAVNLTSITVNQDICGARIGNLFRFGANYGLASSNTVTITSGIVEGNVHGAWILNSKTGTATGNKVNLTDVGVDQDVYGVKIGTDEEDLKAKAGTLEAQASVTNGLASSNTVTITGGRVGRNVYGGCINIAKDGTAERAERGSECGSEREAAAEKVGKYGLASSNTVTINGGKIGGNVFGGYVGGNGKAIYNTINITGSVEFSTATILCGGVCANKTTTDTTTNDAFTGNTLNIETKGVVVKGISNFENYNFYLKNIKSGEVILTATSGGCSWDVGKLDYTSACVLDLSRENIKNISLRTQGVLNKRDYCTLIKSPRGLKYDGKYKQFKFDNEGLLVKYCWEIGVTDNGQELIATLNDKEIRDKVVAKSLSEGYGAGVVCTNNGMDCVLSKMEETESVLGERKGEIGVFCGLAANKYKSSYNEGSHIDMTGMSMMGGVGIRVEVVSKELSSKGQSPKEQSFKEQSSKKLSSKEQSSKEQSSKEQSSKEQSSKEQSSELSFKELSSELTVGAFGEYGIGNSDIDSGLCPCEKKSEGNSNYVGGGLLGRYSICEDEFRGTKLYLEAILRAGRVNNSFNSKEAKDGTGKEYKYDYDDAMYGGCALGGGYKRKVSEKIDLDCSLRYMFGCQGGKNVKRVDADGSRVNFESVKSNRIRVGLRGKYVELERVKPYIGIWYEHELGGKVKGKMQNGKDIVGDIPVTSFGGGTGIMEVGASGKVWKLGVDISGQGYVGVRKGFGGLLKLKYAFGKDAHAKPPKPQPKDK